MQFTGRISLREIELKPVEILANGLDPWIQAVLEKAAPSEALTGMNSKAWTEKAKFETQLRLEKIGQDYLVSGKLSAAVPSPCSRCGDPFQAPRTGKFRILMHPRYHGDDETDSNDSGDPDYVFFDAQEINLIEILAEQLIVLEPVAESPECDAMGKCLLCGENPQFDKTAGQGLESRAFSPFSKLEDLKK